MAPQRDEKLEWPPRAEDLRRLYLDEGLSAAKIAVRYGLKYASPKTAESTILYNLKKNGIWRRDKNEHNRKVTEEMVDDWARRYEAGESLKDIAEGRVSPVTVFNHLKKRGLQLRDKVEAQITAVSKHVRTPFDGDELLKAYLIGIAKGDYWVTSHGRATRVRLGTTHPAMARLFRDLFERHGPIYEYPKQAILTGFEWSLDCDLDSSYRFLSGDQVYPTLRQPGVFASFVAGFFDAEGSVYYHSKNGGGSFECSIANTEGELINEIGRRLSELGYHPKIHLDEATPKRVARGGQIISPKPMWRLGLWRQEEVRRFLTEVPIRHPEKIAKARIALRLPTRPERIARETVLRDWNILKSEIAREVSDYIGLAGKEFSRKRGETPSSFEATDEFV